MRNKLLTTKTFKIDSPNFVKVKIKLKITDTDYTYIGKDGSETKETIVRGFVDNEKIVRNVLSEHKISKHSIDEIVDFLSTIYIMNLEGVGH